jgi:terminase large subunit-like protein
VNVEERTKDYLSMRRMLAQSGHLDFLLRPSQLEIKEWWLSNLQDISVVHAARGYGKTWLALVLAIACAARKGNRRIVYASPSREQSREIVVPTMALLQERLAGALDVKQIAATHQYRLDNGSVIILEGADDDHGNHLRGPFADLAICDETGFWKYCDYAIHSVLFPVVRRRSGRILVLSTSPESVGHEFVGLCETAIRNGGYLKRTIEENRDLTDAEKEAYIEKLGGRNSTAVKRELFCEFVIEADRAVVPEFESSRHVGVCDPPPYRDRYTFTDLGFKDFTHSLFGYWDFQNARLIIEDENAVNYELTTKTAEGIKAKEAALWGEHRPHMRVADNDPQIIADMGALGVYFSPTMKTDKEAAINTVRSMFAADKILIHPRCVQLIHQLKVGIWNKGRSDYERLPGAGHLDGFDALVYGVRMLDRGHNPVPANLGYHISTHFILPHKRVSEKDKLLKLVGR